MDPNVTLGGVTYRLPPLKLKQVKLITPLFGKVARIDVSNVTATEMEAFYDIGFIALSRVVPDLTRELFEEMPIGFEEMTLALPIIAEQAGLRFKGRGAAGEAMAERSTSTN